MWALYVLGPPLEAASRAVAVRLAVLSQCVRVGRSSCIVLAALNAATAGASGRSSGLFGATLVAAKRLNLDVRWLIGLVVINLFITFTVPGISWQGGTSAG